LELWAIYVKYFGGGVAIYCKNGGFKHVIENSLSDFKNIGRATVGCVFHQIFETYPNKD